MRRDAMTTEKRLAREAGATLTVAENLSGTVSRTPEELAGIVSRFASSDGWMDKVRLRAERLV
jgi:formate dehydrogenase assembly factor FdhD